MSLFKIDHEKCKGDGICAQECPTKVISFSDTDKFPAPAEHAEDNCLNCGHCAAVCPHGALTLKETGLEAYPLVQKDLLPTSESIQQFLTSRRSIRKYQKKILPHPLAMLPWLPGFNC